MAQIERGEFFVVTRGFELHADQVGPGESKPRYDRSYEGCVFKALEVCGTVIAAQCVHAEGHKRDWMGRVFSLHTAGLEVWPVTAAYVAALKP